MIFIWLLFELVIIVSANSVNDEESLVEFISQQILALNERKCNSSLIEPDEVYQHFLNYITDRSEHIFVNYENLIKILKSLEVKLLPLK